MKAPQPKPCERNAAFTLRELLVLIAVLTLLSGLVVITVRGAATRRTKVAQCAANLRQFGVALQLYATENRDRLPNTAGNWVWDLLPSVTDRLLTYGMEKRTFYCPGTSPRFNDQLNYLNPVPTSLWNYPGIRVIGYSPALNQSSLVLSNQNTTILSEPPRLNASTFLPIPAERDRVLIADATISENTAGTAANPLPAGSFVNVAGGFLGYTGVNHISPHLEGALPAGGNLAFKDGHVEWRNFSAMSQRAIVGGGGRGFWW